MNNRIVFRWSDLATSMIGSTSRYWQIVLQNESLIQIHTNPRFSLEGRLGELKTIIDTGLCLFLHLLLYPSLQHVQMKIYHDYLAFLVAEMHASKLYKHFTQYK